MFNGVPCCTAADVGFPVRSSETHRQSFIPYWNHQRTSSPLPGPLPSAGAILISWALHGNKSGSPSEQRTRGFDLNGRQHLPPQAASGPRLWFLDPAPPLPGWRGWTDGAFLLFVSPSLSQRLKTAIVKQSFF